MAAVKKTKGRQNIEMTKMTKESNLKVTFSKRRSGIFKKASDLCTLCDAQVDIIAISPGNNAFSFGHPNVEEVIDRFLRRNPHNVHIRSHPVSEAASNMHEAYRNTIIHDLNLELTQVNNQFEAEKKREEMSNQMKKANQERYLWANPIETLQLDQLEQLMESTLTLKKNIKKEVDKFNMVEKSINSNSNKPFSADVGSSSNADGDVCLHKFM